VRNEKIKRKAREIIEALRRVPDNVEVGMKVEFIPKPVLKLYVKINCLMKMRKEESENKKENNKSCGDNDESTCQ